MSRDLSRSLSENIKIKFCREEADFSASILLGSAVQS